MKLISKLWIVFFAVALVFLPGNRALADDTCIFSNADTVKPNIVILLDSGAEMEQIEWHDDYDNTVNYAVDGSVFFNTRGYAVVRQNVNLYYLNPIDNDFTFGTSVASAPNNTATFTISGRAISLPASPSSVAVDGIIDNANRFIYSTNYLNWLFYGPYAGDGSDLPTKSRFYSAKKAIFAVALQTDNRAYFSIYNFANDSGASSVQPIKQVVDKDADDDMDLDDLDGNFVNNINNMGTGTYSPLAEGLATIGGYFNSPSSETVTAPVEYRCQDNFVLVITPGVSSGDLGGNNASTGGLPSTLSDYDGDGRDTDHTLTVDYVTYDIPLNLDGSTFLDDVAYYMANEDMVGYHTGVQPVNTYTVGVMSSEPSRRFLINTSNNGNNTSDEDYGKYHFDATSPDALASALMAAINSILERTNTFTAPVVPVTRTTSGDKIYLSFFKPSSGAFWQGNVVKFGLNDDNEIVDSTGALATNPNGSLKETAEPYWATLDWADTTKDNGVLYSARNIYTYLGGSWTAFTSTNITDPAVLGTPTHTVDEIIDYVRGKDTVTAENREFITGDVLHSEPMVYEYVFAGSTRTMIYFGANDGMLHAVNDGDGTEAWGFIPPHQLPRLKGMLEGTEHLYFVDATPKIYHDDLNDNKIIDGSEQVILVSGERKGSNGYFALDVTNPDTPTYLWGINQSDYSVLAESWSVPVFGRVKTSATDTTGTPVFFIGGGYDKENDPSTPDGKAVLVIDVRYGTNVMTFTDSDMNYSIPSEVRLLDTNSDGFIDKAYVGDMGGQVWRLGNFTGLVFPNTDPDINTWVAQRIFSAGADKKFFYPPSVTLERGYDLVFSGSGDRENPCDPATSDLVFAVKDSHDVTSTVLTPSDLFDVTSVTTVPDLDGSDSGWVYYLDTGEKMLAGGTVFYKVYYFTTFTPNSDPCLPGGVAKLYALNYKTGEAVYDWGRSLEIGGGIPSRPVIVLNEGGQSLLISVGSTNPDADSVSEGAGIIKFEPNFPIKNFFYLWWKELFD
jgi:type IV pilus assembly protein PilY1